jgi:hypothetical protein
MGLGEDLVLLALARRRGDVRQDAGLASALVVARLVTLAEEGRIGLNGGRVVARDAATERTETAEAGAATQASTTAEADLVPVPAFSRDPVFDHVRAAAKGVSVRELIERRAGRARVVSCVARLAADGVVRLVPDPSDRGGIDTLIEMPDRAAVHAAAARLRAIAATSGELPAEDVAFGALAQVAGLHRWVLRGPLRMRARARLAKLSEQRPAAQPEPDRTVRAIVRFAVRAIREGAVYRARREEEVVVSTDGSKQTGMYIGYW